MSELMSSRTQADRIFVSRPKVVIQWLKSDIRRKFPGKAFVSKDDNGQIQYIGQAEHDSKLLSGPILPNKGLLIPVLPTQTAIVKDHFKVLVIERGKIEWVPLNPDGSFRACAAPIPGGKVNGKSSLIGRVNKSMIGMVTVSGSGKTCYVPCEDGTTEVFNDNTYEILCILN